MCKRDSLWEAAVKLREFLNSLKIQEYNMPTILQLGSKINLIFSHQICQLY